MKIEIYSTFLTEHKKTKKSGKKIRAKSWKEAERKCPKDYKVYGKLVEEIDF